MEQWVLDQVSMNCSPTKTKHSFFLIDNNHLEANHFKRSLICCQKGLENERFFQLFPISWHLPFFLLVVCSLLKLSAWHGSWHGFLCVEVFVPIVPTTLPNKRCFQSGHSFENPWTWAFELDLLYLLSFVVHFGIFPEWPCWLAIVTQITGTWEANLFPKRCMALTMIRLDGRFLNVELKK